MKRAALTIVVLVLSLLPVAAQNEVRYKVRLAPVPMDIAMRSTVAGSGSATAVLKGTSLTINGTFEGLRSPATAARLHQGPTMGLRGMPFADLMISKATNDHRLGRVVAGTGARARARSRVSTDFQRTRSRRKPLGLVR